MFKKTNHSDKPNHTSREWAATYKIGKIITSRFSLEEVLSLIAKIASAVTNSDAGCVTLVNTDGNNVSVGGSFGINKAVAQTGPSKFERSIVQCLASNKKPLLINNLKNNQKFRHPSLLKEDNLSSAMCVPAVFNSRLLGALILYSRRPNAYTKDQIKICSALGYHIALAIQNYHLYTNLHVNYFNTIRSLVLAMEAKDPYTKGHSERVTEYALIIASTMGLAPLQIQMIKYCGLLHDLGKIAIPDNILNKPGPLTVSERAQIQRHPAEGASVLSPLEFLREGIGLVKHHHERFDGAGYPDGLRGERIPVTARILACADAYDAMISDRPYRPRLTKVQAIKELKDNAGTQFDPDVTGVFLKSLEN